MLRENLQNALKEAMKNKNMETVSAIRLIIAGLKEKDVAARGAGKECASDADLLSMMQTMIKQRNESARIYKEGNRPELAAKEEAEIAVIERFLPQQLDENETRLAIIAAIVKTHAEGIKDMGKVMAELKANYAGQIDMSKVSDVIKKMLAQRN
ncbi:MAG: GatB/YqeY domain-containing protein [Acetobacter sp.]|nr:GatB/YqeY domain-containing protein [Acetobacter sp.]